MTGYSKGGTKEGNGGQAKTEGESGKWEILKRVVQCMCNSASWQLSTLGSYSPTETRNRDLILPDDSISNEWLSVLWDTPEL